MSAVAPTSPPWLESLLKNENASVFPVHYATTKSKTIRFSQTIFPTTQKPCNPDLKGIGAPIYIINVPFYAPSSKPLQDTAKRIQNLVNLISQQAFHTGGKEAASKLDLNRVFVVIGINRPFSMDADQNEEFIAWLNKLEPIKSIQTHVEGRFWHPKLQYSNQKSAPRSTAKELEIEKKALESFKMVKASSVTLAKKVQDYLLSQHVKKEDGEGVQTRIRAQTPYQQLRNWLKNTTLSFDWVKLLLQKPNSSPPIYLTSLDSDTLSLKGIRAEEPGLFTIFDRWVTQSKIPPQLMSSGYFLSLQENFMTQFANVVDMHIRTKIAKVLPLSVYFPEPCLGILLNELASRISFVGGAGNDTESRRLIENFARTLDPKRVHFVGVRALVTTAPDRLKVAQALAYDKIKCVHLTPEFFKSLRGISQTHFMQKIWAMNMYIGLDAIGAFKKGVSQVTDVTGALMRIVNLFDIPTLMKNVDSFTMDLVAKFYPSYNSELCRIASEFIEGKQNIKVDGTKVNADLLISQLEKMAKELEALKKFDVSADILQKIVLAAAKTGEALLEVLQENFEDFPAAKAN